MVKVRANAGPGGLHPAFARGEAAGRAVGSEIVARPQGDGFNRPFTGTIPTGPGLWISNTTPPTLAGGQLPEVTPWFLTSASLFRPGPPPALATHLYALLSATMLDAQIGCWDAKETYWFMRPWQADPLITVVPAVGKPNHPAYPSGHSCVSSSAAEVLSAFFPEQRAQLEAMVTEAGLSRMYSGIHYRFDIDAGQALGHSVARFTIAADASGNSVLTPQ